MNKRKDCMGRAAAPPPNEPCLAPALAPADCLGGGAAARR